MNWKNISIEENFVKQEIALNGKKAVNYIPMEKIDSFGVISTENARWLYAGAFLVICAITITVTSDFKASALFWVGGIGSLAIYFLTKKTFFSITSNQTKFSVEMLTTPEELQSINAFIEQIKDKIQKPSNITEYRKSA